MRAVSLALLARRSGVTASSSLLRVYSRPVLLAAGLGPAVLALRPVRVAHCDNAAVIAMPRKGTMTTSTPDIVVPTTHAARVKNALLSLVRLLELLLVFV